MFCKTLNSVFNMSTVLDYILKDLGKSKFEGHYHIVTCRYLLSLFVLTRAQVNREAGTHLVLLEKKGKKCYSLVDNC